MTVAYAVTLRNARLSAVATAADAGPAAAILNIYGGTRPATAGAPPGPILAGLTMGDPAFDPPSNGSMQATAITGDTSADNSGTATWFRITDSTGAFVLDGDVGTSGSDLNLNTTTITAGIQVDVTSMIIGGGNP